MSKEITVQDLEKHLRGVVDTSVLAQISEKKMQEGLTGIAGSIQSLGQGAGYGRNSFF